MTQPVNVYAEEAGKVYLPFPDGEARSATGRLKKLSILGNVILVMLFSTSAHAAKNALAPVENALENMGLTPFLYSIVAATPMLGNILLPTTWGSMYAQHEKLVLISVPLGELLGQVFLATGFLLLQVLSGSQFWASSLLVVGFLTFTVFHGGAYVIQCTVLARVLPCGETTGFVATIGFTKCIVATCNFCVPPILEHYGILGVQFALVVPGILSVIAGCCLACLADDFPVPKSRSSSCIKVTEDVALPENSCSPCLSLSHVFKGSGVIFLLSFWRAIVMGALHSFATIQNGLVASYGFSGVQAGQLLGRCQTIALCTLPVIGIVADCAGRRCLIVLMSCVAAISGGLLAMGPGVPEWEWHGSLFMLALASLVIPVVAMSLVRKNSLRSLGWSFGVLESVFSLAQVVFTLIIGVLRQKGGYEYAMYFNAGCLCVGTAASIVLAHCVKDLHSA